MPYRLHIKSVDFIGIFLLVCVLSSSCEKTENSRHAQHEAAPMPGSKKSNSKNNDQESDGLIRRNTFIELLAKEQKIRENSKSETHAQDLLAVLSDIRNEAGSWSGDESKPPSALDREAILNLIKIYEGHELLSIEEYSGGRAIVETGDRKGGLSGSGITYYLIKTDLTWKVVHRRAWLA
jgi:hypothetical protein